MYDQSFNFPYVFFSYVLGTYVYSIRSIFTWVAKIECHRRERQSVSVLSPGMFYHGNRSRIYYQKKLDVQYTTCIYNVSKYTYSVTHKDLHFQQKDKKMEAILKRCKILSKWLSDLNLFFCVQTFFALMNEIW